jgi:hypothetical protein
MKDSLTLEQYKSLCDRDGSSYFSKKGQAYIDALSKLFPLNNKNDQPFLIEDILKQPTLDSFRFEGKNDFEFICHLKARPLEITWTGDRINEKILTSDFASRRAMSIFENSSGVAYMITCIINGKEYIIKFGQTRTPFKDRLGSYNCGVVNNWRTASTTNIKILQSMVTTRQQFNLYIYDCGEPITYHWHGVTAQVASPMSLMVEDVIVKEFMKQYGYKPLANVQADATSSKKKK